MKIIRSQKFFPGSVEQDYSKGIKNFREVIFSEKQKNNRDNPGLHNHSLLKLKFYAFCIENLNNFVHGFISDFLSYFVAVFVSEN